MLWSSWQVPVAESWQRSLSQVRMGVAVGLLRGKGVSDGVVAVELCPSLWSVRMLELVMSDFAQFLNMYVKQQLSKIFSSDLTAEMVICCEIYLFNLVSVTIYWNQVCCPPETGAVKAKGCVCVAGMQLTMDAADRQETIIISASWIWIFLLVILQY